MIIKPEVLFKAGITADQFFMLKYLAEGDKQTFLEFTELIEDEEIIKRDLHKLYQKEYIVNEITDSYILSFDNLEITERGIKVLEGNELSKKNYKGTLEDFIEQYCTLFPTGVKQGNQSVRSSRTECSKRLMKFLREYKFDYDVIIKATKRYVERCAVDNYKYIKIAHYFIYKDGVSTLASECEAILEEMRNGTYTENSFFDEEFGKDVI